MRVKILKKPNIVKAKNPEMWLKYILGIESNSLANYVQNIVFVCFGLVVIESKKNLVNICLESILKIHVSCF